MGCWPGDGGAVRACRSARVKDYEVVQAVEDNEKEIAWRVDQRGVV